jgi:DNA repair protein RecO (recombination protein O)
MRSIKGEAFVLKRKKLFDQNLVLTLFSEEFGKVAVFARGAGKLTSRRSPHLQTGNLVTFIAHKKDSYHYLTETSLISAFQHVKKDSDKLNHQYMLLFMLDRVLAEGQKEEKTYNLVKKFFIELSQTVNFNNSHTELYLNLILRHLGYITESKYCTL